MNTKYTVGQEVAIRECGGLYGNRVTFGWIVSRVTPSGKFTVNRPVDGYTRHFDAVGRETSKTWEKLNYGGRILTDLEAVKADYAARDARQAAATAILAVRVQDSRATYGKGSLLAQVEELEALLAKARAAVEAI